MSLDARVLPQGPSGMASFPLPPPLALALCLSLPLTTLTAEAVRMSTPFF